MLGQQDFLFLINLPRPAALGLGFPAGHFIVVAVGGGIFSCSNAKALPFGGRSGLCLCKNSVKYPLGGGLRGKIVGEKL